MNYLKWIIHLYLGVSAAMTFMVSCSPVEFNRDTRNCGGLGQEACVFNPTNAYVDFDYPFSVPEPAVDVLFVVDTSTSMTEEHSEMADKFDSFISSISGLNWRIGVTSMDISNDPEYYTAGQITNRKSYYGSSTYAFLESYQDGNLIPSSSGDAFLEEGDSTAALQGKFNSMVSIDGKVNNGETYFSTGDERGIFTSAIAIQKHKDSFLREDAHLAIVYLTDEDVRGSGLDQDQEKKQVTDRDLPAYLSSVVENELGKTKKVSLYPIIVESGDLGVPRLAGGSVMNCLDSQGSGDFSNRGGAKVGYLYEDLLDFYPGGTASVCASNYSRLLSNIGNDIEVRTRESIELPCTPVIDSELNLTLEITGMPAGTTYSVSGKTVSFDPALPPGQSIHVKFSCTDL